MQLGYAVLYLQFAFLIGWLAWLAWYIYKHCDKVQREQMLAVVFFGFAVATIMFRFRTMLLGLRSMLFTMSGFSAVLFAVT